MFTTILAMSCRCKFTNNVLYMQENKDKIFDFKIFYFFFLKMDYSYKCEV